jgi:hypothetical protein
MRPRSDIDEATIMPSTDNGISAAVHGVSPCSRVRVCMWRYEAITASSTTLAVVVRRIATSTRLTCTFIAQPAPPHG